MSLDGIKKSEEEKLLVAFTPFSCWSPHFETELEIIQRHLDQGGAAVVLSCDGELKTCEPNPEHDLLVCAMCKSRCRSGMRWLRGAQLKRETFYCLTQDQATIVRGLEEKAWHSVDEVKAFSIDGMDVGLAAFSSVVSSLRDPEPQLEGNRKLFAKNMATAATVYYSIKNQLTEKVPNVFLIFNGRFSSLRPALRVAQQLGIKSYVHERAGGVDRFSITEDTYPHDLKALKVEIEKVYFESELPDEEKRELAFGWFNERRAGVDQSWRSYTKNQERHLLPNGFSPEDVNVVIFNSSEDEFVAIEEWKNLHYLNQNIAISQLMDDIAGEKRIRIFLRVHPNLKHVSNAQTKGIKVLAKKYEDLNLIPADSPVSTYALIDAADVVVSYGSTVGVEAAYSGKLSILMGRAMYEDLDVCIRPESHRAFIEMLKNIAAGRHYYLPEMYQIGLVKFGLFNKLWGTEFKYVIPHGLVFAKMRRGHKTTTILPNIFIRIIFRLRSEFRSIKLRFKR